MSPHSDHEEDNRNLSLLVELLAEELHLEIRNLGSTTFKIEAFQRGFEPDSCFYIQNEARIRNRRRIDLLLDPPPDLVIEVDLTNDSIDKFPIFAKLGVPEVWRVSGGKVEILTRKGNRYQRQASSCAFPILSALELTELQQAGISMKHTDWVRHLRSRFRRLKRSSKTIKP